ncbi:MAG: flippase-like domain-containing protein [Phycisphaerae bacterium]|nr:flippase-like domain-containing protein [Phycisphaerae bacterium]
MKKKAGSRWAMTFLRTGLCLAAVVFLLYNVNWHDSVRLGDADGEQVRLREQRGGELVIERNGRQETRPCDDFYQEPGEEGLEPVIELGIPNVVLQVDKRLALFAILIFAPVWFIQAYRLVLMISIQGVKLRYWNAVKLTFAGNFFNFALPGTTGGDLVKAYYITHYTHRKTEVVTTIFLDRAIGLLGMVLLAAFAILMSWDPEEFGYLISTLGLILGGLLVGSIIVFSRRVRQTLRLSELAARLPMGEQLLRVGRATIAMRQHKLRVAVCLVLTFILQTIVMTSAAIMAWALGMTGDLFYYITYVAIGFLIAAIPISPPQAIGVMEAFYVQFFTRGGLNTASQAVALALAVRLIQLVWAIPGVLVPLLGAHLPKKAELDALSQESAADTEETNDGDGKREAVVDESPRPETVAPSASQE